MSQEFVHSFIPQLRFFHIAATFFEELVAFVLFFIETRGFIAVGGRPIEVVEMITRSNLAEQLREYQFRSKHDWATVSFFSSTQSSSSR
ncbi:hypothetical protein KSP40_PGU014045 [Platanthera guangdongensis]|uniref:Maturase K n=1 Tax=Platanthera guangdongensis TaxID=2320717 RepID=A0ABR2MQW6_9ASPA